MRKSSYRPQTGKELASMSDDMIAYGLNWLQVKVERPKEFKGSEEVIVHFRRANDEVWDTKEEEVWNDAIMHVEIEPGDPMCLLFVTFLKKNIGYGVLKRIVSFGV